MKIILYNDDFGATYGLSEAVRESFLNGTTSCASVRTNGLAFRYAIEKIVPAIPDLELGLHVNLTEGPTDADPSRVSRLINEKGYLKRSFLDYYLAVGHDQELLREIEIEIGAQFEKAAASGLKLNHVNGHQHIHMIPPIFKIICKMMNAYGIRFIRVPLEPFFFSPCLGDSQYMVRNLNPLKYLLLRRLSLKSLEILHRNHLSCVGCFVGILYTGRMTVGILKKALAKMEKRGIGTAEVLFHPADIGHEKDVEARGNRVPHYYYLKERKIEKDNLVSLEMRTLLKSRNIKLVNHRQLENSSARGFGV